jgi:hypothetical protein
VEVRPEGSGEVGTVAVRFHDVASGQMMERRWTIPYEAEALRLEKAGPAMQLAATAMFLGEKLRGSAEGEAVDLRELARIGNRLPGGYPADARVRDLLEMVREVREMAGE